MEDSLLEAPRTAGTIEYTTIDVKSLIRGIAGDHSEVLIAIGESESNLKSVTGITGDRGVFQFSPDTWKLCEGDPFDIEDSTRCALKFIKDNQLWRWKASMYDRGNYQGWYNKLSTTTKRFVDEQMILCSCIKYANKYINLPKIQTPADLQPNSRPSIGAAVLLEYNIGGSHIAIITNIYDDGFEIKEANFKKCKQTYRFLNWSDNHIRGFFFDN